MKTNLNNKTGRVLPSAAIKKAYYKKLMKIIDDMDRSVKYFLEARYKKEENEIVAKDSASNEVEDVLKKLYRRWGKQFDYLAKDIANWFVKSSGCVLTASSYML